MSGAAHGEPLVAEVRTALHDAAPDLKVMVLIGFALGVAFVPTGVWWPFAVDALVVGSLAAWGRVPVRGLALRVAIELPFVLFVVLLPLVSGREGLELAGAILAKATLVVVATGVLSAVTPAPELIAGLQRLRVPAVFVAVGALAVRYLQVVLDELRRVNGARLARGHEARWLWQAPAAAQSAGALAVRCLDRGERVHRAMLARGWDGRMPDLRLSAAPAAGGPSGDARGAVGAGTAFLLRAAPVLAAAALALPAVVATIVAHGGAR